MRGLAITHKGLEGIAALEVKELIKRRAKEADFVVTFNSRLEELCRLCYLGRSFRRVLVLIADFDLGNDPGTEHISRLLKGLKGAAFWDWIKKGKSFMVRTLHAPGMASSADVSPIVGGAVIDCIEKGLHFHARVDLEDPDIRLIAFVSSTNIYIGIDLAGFDLSKRDYKIFSSPISIKGTIAYGLLRLAGYEASKTLLDPFANCGTIAIEAALFATARSPHYFRKKEFAFAKMPGLEGFDFQDRANNKAPKIFCLEPNRQKLAAAKKNAKIADANKLISFSSVDLEWLDTRFDKGSTDLIITDVRQLPGGLSFYRQLFYQADYVLSKRGCIALLTENLPETAGFKIESKCGLASGHAGLTLTILKRGGKRREKE